MSGGGGSGADIPLCKSPSAAFLSRVTSRCGETAAARLSGIGSGSVAKADSGLTSPPRITFAADDDDDDDGEDGRTRSGSLRGESMSRKQRDSYVYAGKQHRPSMPSSRLSWLGASCTIDSGGPISIMDSKSATYFRASPPMIRGCLVPNCVQAKLLLSQKNVDRKIDPDLP